ncbi:MAG: hypothetical protein IIA61_08975 [Candidatus Marinimicrobia bacterium]|nr:hypothetical protein [Candidatus Neomarinimicrobiota bacterium]
MRTYSYDSGARTAQFDPVIDFKVKEVMIDMINSGRDSCTQSTLIHHLSTIDTIVKKE